MGDDEHMLVPSIADADLSRVFRASQLSTPLTDAVVVDLREPTDVAHEKLTVARFDQAPVVDQSRKSVGWVRTDGLASAVKVKAVLQPLARCTILAMDAPLKDLLIVLNHEQLVFLAGHQGLEAFVTPSDLDRHAARGHFYLLISGIEMLLSDLVDRAVDPNVIEEAIQNQQREAWQAALTRNLETRPVEYLNLRELAELFRATVAIDGLWGNEYDNMLTALCHLRPSVMHPVRPLLAERQPSQLAQLATCAELVTQRLHEHLERLGFTGKLAISPGDSVA